MTENQKNLANFATLCTFLHTQLESLPTLKEKRDFLITLKQYFNILDLEFEKINDQIKKEYYDKLVDNGNKISDPIDFDGLNIYAKFSYPKPTLNADKLKTELERAYSEIGTKFVESDFLKEATPRKIIIIQ